jgi:hypothetical protein
MGEKFIHSMFDLGSAIRNEQDRLYSLARSVEDVGLNTLAVKIVARIDRIEAIYEEMLAAHSSEQAEELREHEKSAGEMLLFLLENAGASQ